MAVQVFKYHEIITSADPSTVDPNAKPIAFVEDRKTAQMFLQNDQETLNNWKQLCIGYSSELADNKNRDWDWDCDWENENKNDKDKDKDNEKGNEKENENKEKKKEKEMKLEEEEGKGKEKEKESQTKSFAKECYGEVVESFYKKEINKIRKEQQEQQKKEKEEQLKVAKLQKEIQQLRREQRETQQRMQRMQQEMQQTTQRTQQELGQQQKVRHLFAIQSVCPLLNHFISEFRKLILQSWSKSQENKTEVTWRNFRQTAGNDGLAEQLVSFGMSLEDFLRLSRFSHEINEMQHPKAPVNPEHGFRALEVLRSNQATDIPLDSIEKMLNVLPKNRQFKKLTPYALNSYFPFASDS